MPFLDLLGSYQAPHAATAASATNDDWEEEVYRLLALHEQELSRVSDEDFFA